MSHQRDLVHLLHGGDARRERHQRLGPLELDGPAVAGPAELGRLVAHDELESAALGQAPDEVPVRLVVLADVVVRVAARVALEAQPVLGHDLLDDVGGGLVLEDAHLARAVQQVGAVVAAHEQAAAAGAELGLQRDDVALEQRLGGLLVLGAEPDLELRADRERLVVDPVGLREGEDDRADVGQPQVVDDADLLDPVAMLLRDLGAVDQDAVERDVIAGGHQSSPGIVRSVPRAQAQRVVDAVGLGDRPPARRDRRTRGRRSTAASRRRARGARACRPWRAWWGSGSCSSPSRTRSMPSRPGRARGRPSPGAARRWGGRGRTGSSARPARTSAGRPSPSGRSRTAAPRLRLRRRRRSPSS